MTMQDALDGFIMDRKARGLSAATIMWYEYRIKATLQGALGRMMASVTIDDMRGLISAMRKGKKPSTINGHIRAVKALINWADDEGLPIQFTPKRLHEVKEPQHVPVVLEREQIALMLQQPDRSTYIGVRAYTMMLLLADTGMRVGELVGLRVGDYSFPRITVLGKGNKQRVCSVSDLMQEPMESYLVERSAAAKIMGWETDAMFINSVGGPLSKVSVQQMVATCARQAGITDIHVTPHAFRSTYATHFLRQDGDITSLMESMGHTSLAMSLYYAKMSGVRAFNSRAKTALDDSLVKSPPHRAASGEASVPAGAPARPRKYTRKMAHRMHEAGGADERKVL